MSKPDQERRTMRFAGRIYGGEDRDVPVYVTPINANRVRVSQSTDPKLASEYGPVMTRAALEHFEHDVSGRLKPLPPATRAEIAAVQRGEAELLGKGDDGVVYRVGRRVVKVSTTVPYQPFNPGHRTPKQAGRMLRRQAKLGSALSRAGVPHLQDSDYVWLGDKGFQIKDYVEIPEQLTKQHIDDARAALEALHAKGYVLNDSVQIGVDDRGRTVLYDIGKVARAPKGSEGVEARKDDMRALERLAHDHHLLPPKKPLSGHQWFWDMARRRAEKLIAEGDREAAVEHMVKARDRIDRAEVLTEDEADELAEAENNLWWDLEITLPRRSAPQRNKQGRRL